MTQENITMHISYGVKSCFQILSRYRNGARRPKFGQDPDETRPSKTCVGGATQPIHHQCDLSSQRIASIEGSGQPLADGAAGMPAGWH